MLIKHGQLFNNKKTGKTYQVIGMCFKPTVTLDEVGSNVKPYEHKRIDVAMNAPIFNEWFEEVKNEDERGDF